MNTASTTAARDLYAADDTLPPPGSRVWITGFSRPEHESVEALLQLHGLLPTAFANGADAVLVPSPPSTAILADARRSGRRVLVPERLRGASTAAGPRLAVETDDETVRILDVTLPRRPAADGLVPPASQFAHLCLDRLFLRAARAVAQAAQARLPCALEGETAVAKTTAVLWTAHLCRQGVVRLNLNGQSDTGELVGRFVPSTDWADWDLPLMHRERHLLDPVSQSVIDRAVREERPLNWVERTTLAARERIPPTAWRFWEGIVPAAMRSGRWVVLDELNLAEPQVLERLNPVLESPPTLVLAEHTGERFGPDGDVPVADSFRIFATLNPAEYAGRSPLSPAFRDRWSLWNVLEQPGEADFRAMLARLVHGVQPEFITDGVAWKAADGVPSHPGLSKAAGIDDRLDAIASFHSAVAAGAGGNGSAPEIGRLRRERYVFTRRTLLAAMGLFAAAVERGTDAGRAACEALERIYVERVQPGPDRQAVRSALRAVGLSR